MGIIVSTISMVICFFVIVMKNTPKESDTKREKYDKYIIIVAAFMLNVSAICYGIFCENFTQKFTPKAIDVYRGKTELVITNKTIDNNITIESDTLVRYKIISE